ncbi:MULTISPECIES: hypothetical protein [Frankia]|uniref:Uncharacterized protein n=1 Tax=Frankia alni (strain DSM 45986 / CECT 9034 / ACN14a) TaxID=326424 RepID=Q0RN71_FRAAA|nr:MULTISPECIES: hypothetical protein [Frankia]CAJ61018.1 hypothetical protein FRAAL2369 [Frankia alni ACN14a]
MTLFSTDRIATDAQALEGLRAEVRTLCALRNLDQESWRRWEQKAGLFKASVRDYYAPFEAAAAALRAGAPTELETAVLFLEADPWCFRSGYMKSKLMSRIANSVDIEAYRSRLQNIVVCLVRNPQPRLLRPTVRLAAAVWDENLQGQLTSIPEDDSVTAERLRAFMRLVGHQIRTMRGLRF